VKFLIDRCAGRRLADWLRAQGHDVVESRERGRDPGDRALLAWAAQEERIVVTMDKDFGEIVFVEKAPHCGLVRLPDVPADKRILLMEKVLARHARELSEQSIITVRGGRIRVSRSTLS
jgi:predicted nuclease of predicted toxin-antitoxin system